MLMATAGSEFDSAKSAVLQRLAALPAIRRILIVEDDARQGRHISAVLHLLLGRQVMIDVFRSMSAATGGLRRGIPDLIVLDDHPPPMDRAVRSFNAIRRLGCAAPVVIVSSILTRERRIELSHLQALCIVDKDDVNTFVFAEVLARLLPASDQP